MFVEGKCCAVKECRGTTAYLLVAAVCAVPLTVPTLKIAELVRQAAILVCSARLHTACLHGKEGRLQHHARLRVDQFQWQLGSHITIDCGQATKGMYSTQPQNQGAVRTSTQYVLRRRNSDQGTC